MARSWGPVLGALAGGHNPGELPGEGHYRNQPDSTTRMGFFLIAKVCLEDEDSSGDTASPAGHVAGPCSRAAKHLALHKTGAAALQPAQGLSQPGGKQGETGDEAAPTGHQGHRNPTAGEPGGSLGAPNPGEGDKRWCHLRWARGKRHRAGVPA